MRFLEIFGLWAGKITPISSNIQKKIDDGITFFKPGNGENTYYFFNKKWYRYTHNYKGEECIVYVPNSYLPSWVKYDYLEFVKNKRNMKRFKTKQELDSKGISEKFNLPYGEPFGNDGRWNIGAKYFTDDPHPYEGKNFKLRVTPEESEMVQKKAFALGYRWVDQPRTEVYISNNPILYINDSDEYKFLFCDDSNPEEYIEITPQQFMDGELPAADIDFSEVSGWKRFGSNTVGSGEAKKPDDILDDDERLRYGAFDGADAYIKYGILYLDTGGVTSLDLPLLIWAEKLHKFNIISEEAFKKKHPDKLKFKDWDVKTDTNYVKVGCVTAEKDAVRAFMDLSDLIIKNDVTLYDAYQFLSNNEKKLGF